MTLTTLADSMDLLDRGVTIPEGVDGARLLASASAAIRDAAGSTISRVTSTITLTGSREPWLPVPLGPITSVTDVTIDGVTVSDWKLRDARLWRACGWQPSREPSEVGLTVTHGLTTVPGDIIDLCCSLVAAAAAATEDGYDPGRGLTSLAIDDYREGHASGEDEVVSPMELPERTRAWLRGRFSSTATVVGTY